MTEQQFWFKNCIMDTIVEESGHGPSDKECTEIAKLMVKSFCSMLIVVAQDIQARELA